MTISEDIQKQIQLLSDSLDPQKALSPDAGGTGPNLGSIWHEYQYNPSYRQDSDGYQRISKQVNDTRQQIQTLTANLNEQLNKELNEIKIETKLDIPPNPLNQIGVQTNQNLTPLLLFGGLVAAALILK